MGKVLAELAKERRGGPSECALAGIAFGGLVAGIGVWVAVSDDASGTAEQGVLSGMFLGLGGAGLAGGIRCAFSASGSNAEQIVERERYDRFRAVQAAGALNVIALAGFESELRSQAEAARLTRHAEGAASFGLAAGGLALTGLALGEVLEGSAQTVGYVVGVSYALVGIMSGALELAGESEHESAWRRYEHPEAAEDPDGESQSLGFRFQPTGISGWF